MLNKKLMNQQHIVCDLCKIGKKAAQLEWLFSLIDGIQSKFKTCQSWGCLLVWRESFGKLQGGFTKRCQRLFNSQYHINKKLVGEPFWYFWKFQVFPEFFVAVHLCGVEILVNYRKGITNRCAFIGQKNSRGAFSVFVKASGTENYAKRGYHVFS